MMSRQSCAIATGGTRALNSAAPLRSVAALPGTRRRTSATLALFGLTAVSSALTRLQIAPALAANLARAGSFALGRGAGEAVLAPLVGGAGFAEAGEPALAEPPPQPASAAVAASAASDVLIHADARLGNSIARDYPALGQPKSIDRS